MKEFTGRVCDCCGVNEPFQKVMTLLTRKCSNQDTIMLELCSFQYRS